MTGRRSTEPQIDGVVRAEGEAIQATHDVMCAHSPWGKSRKRKDVVQRDERSRS